MIAICTSSPFPRACPLSRRCRQPARKGYKTLAPARLSFDLSVNNQQHLSLVKQQSHNHFRFPPDSIITIHTLLDCQHCQTYTFKMCTIYINRYLRCGHAEEPMLVPCGRKKDKPETCPAGVTTEYNDFNQYCPNCQQYVTVPRFVRKTLT